MALCTEIARSIWRNGQKTQTALVVARELAMFITWFSHFQAVRTLHTQFVSYIFKPGKCLSQILHHLIQRCSYQNRCFFCWYRLTWKSIVSFCLLQNDLDESFLAHKYHVVGELLPNEKQRCPIVQCRAFLESTRRAPFDVSWHKLQIKTMRHVAHLLKVKVQWKWISRRWLLLAKDVRRWP